MRECVTGLTLFLLECTSIALAALLQSFAWQRSGEDEPFVSHLHFYNSISIHSESEREGGEGEEKERNRLKSDGDYHYKDKKIGEWGGGEREREFEFEFIFILQRLQIRQDASFHLAVNTEL